MTTLTPASESIRQFSTLPTDYAERVYAGILGKLIGVYLGRPFEGWSHERILEELGEIDHYVHENFDLPLVVTDDDVAGTFTFLRALEDSGYDPNLTPAQIGEAWLNYLIEKRTILWWGGLGMSTEHTAYMRLKNGIPAPLSGSMETNGKTIAEQIGSQIFIDGWAMLFPGDPEAAVDFARRAGSVSHDGEAIYGAQSIAAMEAMAFVESDINVLLDTAASLVPADSVINRLIHDVRNWKEQDQNWYETLYRIQGTYGYDKYRGNCHMVPNHALIVLALLWGNSDFRESQMIVNTAGWDTDCNAGNVGAILGIKDGLATLGNSGYDFRTPVADRMYLSSAEGGRAISDAVQETHRIVIAAKELRGESVENRPARFDFAFPGSVQGFEADPDSPLDVSNEGGGLRLSPVSADGGAAFTPTFTPMETLTLRTYNLYASPLIHPGQTITASLTAPDNEATASLEIRVYGKSDELTTITGPSVNLTAGERSSIMWEIPDTDGYPIAQLGVRVNGNHSVEINSIDWTGAPTTSLTCSDPENSMWKRAWVDGMEQWSDHWTAVPFVLSHNEGTGLVMQGTEEWKDYEVTSEVTVPLAASAGIVGRAGGMRRYYSLTLDNDGFVRIARMLKERTILAETPIGIDPDRVYALSLRFEGSKITAVVDGETVLTAEDSALVSGATGFVITEGTLTAEEISVKAL